MATRLKPLKLGEALDPAVNGIIQFSKDGFGDTQMFGLIARRPELLKANVRRAVQHPQLNALVEFEPERLGIITGILGPPGGRGARPEATLQRG